MVTVADPGREFTFTRTELFAGAVEWKHVLVPEGTGTRVLESYTVLKPLTIVGWFIIGTLYGLKDRRSERTSAWSTRSTGSPRSPRAIPKNV